MDQQSFPAVHSSFDIHQPTLTQKDIEDHKSIATDVTSIHHDRVRIGVTIASIETLAESTSTTTMPINHQLREVVIHGQENGDEIWKPPTRDALTTQLDTTMNLSVSGSQSQTKGNEHQHQTILELGNARNLLAPVSKAHYQTVPYEILHLISTYLDGHSLSRLNRVDTASRAVTSKQELWASLLEEPWNGAMYLDGYDRGPSKLVLKGIYRKSHPREFYVARYQTACEKRMIRLGAYRLRIEQIKREHRSYICHYINDVLVPPTTLLMFILFTIFLIVQLSRNESITWFTCWPLIIIAILIFFASTLLYFKKSVFASAGFLTSDFYFNSTSILKRTLLNQTDEDEDCYAHCMVWVMSCSVSLFLIFLSLKLTGHLNDWSWYTIFTPAYTIFFLHLVSPLLGCVSNYISMRERVSNWLISWILLFGPLFTFTILLNVHLDQTTLSVIIIFIPLFLMDFFVLTSSWSFLYVAGDEMANESRCRRCLSAFPGAAAIWFLVSAPFVTFKILLALKLDGNTQLSDEVYTKIFIPLYLTLFLLTGLTIHLFNHEQFEFKFNRSWTPFEPPPTLPEPDK